MQERFPAFSFFGLHAREPFDCSFVFRAGPLSEFPILASHIVRVYMRSNYRPVQGWFAAFVFFGPHVGEPFDCIFLFQIGPSISYELLVLSRTSYVPFRIIEHMHSRACSLPCGFLL